MIHVPPRDPFTTFGLERHEEMLRALTEDRDAIKVYVEVNGDG